MTSPLTILGIALVGALTVTEFVRVVAVRMRVVDEPGGRRVHRRTTPRLGGIGIVWGFLCSIGWVALLTGGDGPFAGQGALVLGLLVAALGMALLGQMDDRWSLPATAKLAVGIGAALVLWGTGWRLETVGLPGVGAWSLGMWSLPATVAWVVLVTNAVNLVDGLDGLAGGVGFLVCVGLLALPGLGATERTLALALAGAVLGFLWFNLHPALIFMGDAGSLFLGVMLAALTLRMPESAVPGAFPLVPLLLLIVPLGDTSHAIVRRSWVALREAPSIPAALRSLPRRVFAPDRGHVHHRLQDLGLSPRRAAGVLWLVTVSTVLLAASWARTPLAGLLATVAVGSIWGWGVLAVVSRRVRAARVSSASAAQEGARESARAA